MYTVMSQTNTAYVYYTLLLYFSRELALNCHCWVDGFKMAQPEVLDLCGQQMATSLTKVTNAFIFLVKTLDDAAKDPPFKENIS